MDAAVAQFFVVQVGRLRALVGQFLDAGDFLALALRLLDPFENFLRSFRMLVEVVVECTCDEVVYKGTDRRTVRCNIVGT